MTITLTREEAQQAHDALLNFEGDISDAMFAALTTLRAKLAQPEPKKLWLWKNFVDGRPEYWAFDNPYPTNLEDGDPQTLGQPCGYAIFKPSRDGSNGRTEEQVLREMASVKSKAQPERKWQGLTAAEMMALFPRTNDILEKRIAEFALAIEAKLKEKNT